MTPAYFAVKAERFGDLADLQAEAARPVPPPPHRKGGAGLTRLEQLLLHLRAGRLDTNKEAA